MKGYSLHSFQPNTTLANLLMPILMRTARIFAVIEMNCLQSVQAYDLIKLAQNAVEVIDYVVAGIPGMACIKAHAKLVTQLYSVYDLF